MITTKEIVKRYLEIQHKYTVALAENDRLRQENAELREQLESPAVILAEGKDAKAIVQEIYDSIMKAS